MSEVAKNAAAISVTITNTITRRRPSDPSKPGSLSESLRTSPRLRQSVVDETVDPPQAGGDAVGNESFRLFVHSSVGGSQVRLRFSNRYGDAPLTLRNLSAGFGLQK